MATWTASDGTVVEQSDRSLVVLGDAAFATFLRGELELLEEGVPRRVQVGPEPSGDVALDVASAWLVDVCLRDLAFQRGLTVTSDYVARDEDAPPKARRLLARRWRNDPPGTIY